MDLSAAVWPSRTTSGFNKTGRSVIERRLTSNETVAVDRRNIWCNRLQNGGKRRPTRAYAQTGSRNMAETNSQYPTSYSTLIQYMDLSAGVWRLKTTSGLVGFFIMATTAILDFQVYQILRVERVKRTSMRHRAKFHGDRKNRCWVSIFRQSLMMPNYIALGQRIYEKSVTNIF